MRPGQGRGKEGHIFFANLLTARSHKERNWLKSGERMIYITRERKMNTQKKL